MDIFIVGLYKKDKTIAGFKVVSIDGTKTDKMDVSYADVVNTVKAKRANFVNVKLDGNDIKGVNGSLDRYGVIGKSQSLVILREVHNNKGNFEGYICSDCMGNIKFLTEKEAVQFAEKIGIANGKVVTGTNKEKHISSIEGTYPIYNRASTPDKQQEAQLPKEAIELIDKMKAYKQYPNSYASKVCKTIETKKVFTDKQKACLNRIRRQWDKEEAEEQAKGQTVSTDNSKAPVTEEAKSVQRRPMRKTNDVISYDLLKYTKMKNGKVYVTGLKDSEHDRQADVEIPDTITIEGKTYKVSGISLNAFTCTQITGIKTGKYIDDIGQGAFANCSNLINADFSESKHSHIPMRLFINCKNLTDVKVGKNVQRIHEQAFKDCKSLYSIELPESTDTIAREAFFNCKSLIKVRHNAKAINDSAFRDCIRLNDINLNTVLTIGSNAFRYTGFTELTIPGTVTSLGTKAFANCNFLNTVKINEGLSEIGDYCFAKSTLEDYAKNHRDVDGYTVINNIDTPKSIKKIGADAFRNCTNVNVYVGSVSESHCIGFGVPYTQIDYMTEDNSTRIRMSSALIGADPTEVLWNLLKTEREGASNPEFVMNTKNLVNIPLNENSLEFFKLNNMSEPKEPHILFKAAVNYLQDISTLFKDPLSDGVLRLQNTFYVDTAIIIDDGYNRIIKVTYKVMDTLESGSFILVTTGNCLRYVANLDNSTDIFTENVLENNYNVPVKKFMHVGDKIGDYATINGHKCIYTDPDTLRRINVGKEYFERLHNNGIKIQLTRKEYLLYIPVEQTALLLHEAESNDKNKNKDKFGIFNVLKVYSYDEFLAHMKDARKTNSDSKKFFKELSSMTKSEVNKRLKYIGIVEEEKEAQLFSVSKQFNKILEDNGIDYRQATPNDLPYNLFNELSTSYWMISKDEAWLKSTGEKSLNKTNEYTIGRYKLFEYKSNQVVKFSNPYMNGQKGAYVFTLIAGNNIIGVYASRYSMQVIINKLVRLTIITDNVKPVELMTSADNIERVDPRLFYPFYDVLYSKNGWNLNQLVYTANQCTSFHISMYKPTGIFYLVADKYEVLSETDSDGNKKTAQHVILPILPIGNMDRALMVATTTNTNAKDSDLLKELIKLSVLETLGESRMKYNKEFTGIKVNNYYTVRQYVIDGVKDISKYKELISDRAVYMLGTVHQGQLQREHGYSEDDDIDNMEVYMDNISGDSDFEDEDIDLSEFDIDEDSDIDDSSDELLDIEIEVDDDEDTDGEDVAEVDLSQVSFDEFKETALEMGITDESQIRAMYVSFINR